MKRLSLIEKLTNFIKRAKEIHGDKYNYDKVIYLGSNIKVEIFCNNCKKYFWQSPSNHLRGHGCKDCAIKKQIRWNTEKFVEESKKVHGNLFSYELTEWKGYRSKLKVTCTKCGTVTERYPENHLKGQGCENCYKIELSKRMSIDFESFVKRSKDKFGEGVFNYSKSNYVNMETPIVLVCQKHGDFTITPRAHLISNYGCPFCGKEGLVKKNRKIDIEDTNLIEKLKLQLEEGKTYEELADSYGVSAHCLGQTAKFLGLSSHKPFNNLSSGERNTIIALRDLSIVNLTSICEERVEGILGRIKTFVIPDFKFIYNNVSYWIEYNGKQHYEFSSIFHHNNIIEFEEQLKRDENVRSYCKNNNIVLIEIPYIINTYDKIRDFLDKVIIQKIDPTTLIDYNSLYKRIKP